MICEYAHTHTYVCIHYCASWSRIGAILAGGFEVLGSGAGGWIYAPAVGTGALPGQFPEEVVKGR